MVEIQVKLRHLRERWTTPYVCVCMIRGQRNREKICECKKGGVAFQFHICRQPRQKKPFYLTPLKRFCPPFALHLTIHTIPCLIYLGQSPRNARIFTGNKIPGQKIFSQNIAERKIMVPKNSRNSIFSKIKKKYFLRKFQDFFLARVENSWTFSSTQFQD